MLAAAGLLILVAMGYSIGGMVADGGGDRPLDGDDDASLPGDGDPTPEATLPVVPIGSLLPDTPEDETDAEDQAVTPAAPPPQEDGDQGTPPASSLLASLLDIPPAADTAPESEPETETTTETEPTTETEAETENTIVDPSPRDLPPPDLSPVGSIQDMLGSRSDMASILGANNDDAYTGGPNDDAIGGTDGGDAIFGNEGNDTLDGGAGADELYGDLGDDSLLGGAGQDFLVGEDGDDTLMGGDEDDRIFGGDGNDQLAGDAGDDFLQGGFGADTLSGGACNDTLDGTYGERIGDGPLVDTDQADQLFGGDGDDAILIGKGDIATGGEGRDSFITGSDALTEADVGHVSDFDPTQDVIEIMFDPDKTPNPLITVMDAADGSGANVYFNGGLILTLGGAQGLEASMIQLRPITLSPEA